MSTSSPKNYRPVGIVLAVSSGIFIGIYAWLTLSHFPLNSSSRGSSFVLKKKGLLRSQKGHTAGEGVAYLKSVSFWLECMLKLYLKHEIAIMVVGNVQYVVHVSQLSQVY